MWAAIVGHRAAPGCVCACGSWGFSSCAACTMWRALVDVAIGVGCKTAAKRPIGAPTPSSVVIY
eukprot:3331275-Prymnesium_polylepis.2